MGARACPSPCGGATTSSITFFFSPFPSPFPLSYLFPLPSAVTDPPAFIYMGAHKEENEELIAYGLPEDVWCVLLQVYSDIRMTAAHAHTTRPPPPIHAAGEGAPPSAPLPLPLPLSPSLPLSLRSPSPPLPPARSLPLTLSPRSRTPAPVARPRGRILQPGFTSAHCRLHTCTCGWRPGRPTWTYRKI